MHAYSPDEYQIGTVCALPKELKAVRAIFEEEHEPLQSQDEQDNNSYVLGQIGLHKVVAAGLPGGVYGINAATSVAKDMLRTFPHLRFGLLVGIGGGIPNLAANRDVRLGDVVVSQPSGEYGGVVQYDFQKDLGNGQFERVGHLNKPPKALLTALTNLQSELRESPIPRYLEEIEEKYPALRDQGYRYPGANKDCLYCSKCDVSAWWWFLWAWIVWFWPLWQCEDCDKGRVKRPPRSHSQPVVHYGTIVSANTLLKNVKRRDQLGNSHKALCVEMEAAGFMDEFPCLVIRGICDYADANKNDIWHEYAALTAAVFAKQLLENISPHAASEEKPIPQVLVTHETDFILLDRLDRLDRHFKQQQAFIQQQEVHYHNKRYRNCHRAFKTPTDYESQKNVNPDAVPGTCRWVLDHPQFKEWSNTTKHDLLWISADPGCGKSVLSKYLVDVHLPQLDNANVHTICYFFFKDNEEQNRLAAAFCAILHQLFSQQPRLIRHAQPAFGRNGYQIQRDIYELWRILGNVAKDTEAQPIIYILDALDECSEKDRLKLINFLCQFHNDSQNVHDENGSSVRWLVTSRPYDNVRDGFEKISEMFPSIRLRGEDETDQVRNEINLVIHVRMGELSKKLKLTTAKTEEVTAQLLDMEHRTYLWLYLALDEIEKSFRRTLRETEKIVPLVPKSVEDVYEKILQRGVDKAEKQYAKAILTIIVGAQRPLTLGEMALALDVATLPDPPSALTDLTIGTDQLADNIRRWCGLFVLINSDRLYLIHQTAKEFLLTHHDRDLEDDSWKHSLRFIDVEKAMARICALFLCLSEFSEGQVDKSLLTHDAVPSILNYSRDSETTSQRTFFEFAAENWAHHVRFAESCLDEDTRKGVETIYKASDRQYTLWIANSSWEGRRLNWQIRLGDIHAAAFNGHNQVIKKILNSQRNVDDRDSGGRTALIWAAEQGYIQTISILIDNGADVNAQYGEDGKNALWVASHEGHLEIVQALLDKGADFDAHGGKYGNSLCQACCLGYPEIVQALLDGGADVNDQGGVDGSGLYGACLAGHLGIVQMLLDGGADINSQGVECSGNLYGACSGGHLKIVEVLLDRGANVNAQNEQGKSALWVACHRGYLEIVHVLLRHGAEFETPGGSAIQEASYGGHAEIVHALLDKGADVNSQGGKHGSALQAACFRGYSEVVQILLAKGAHVNAHGGMYGPAIRAASYRCHLELMQVLLDHGADINTPGDDGDNALQTASLGRNREVVRFLLNKGASVNAQGGRHGYALCAASFVGNFEVVQLLLNHGADVNVQGGQYGTALQAACDSSKREVVEVLLDAGADTNAHGGEYGHALQAACSGGYLEIVQMLLDNGADVNAQGGKYGNALSAACSVGSLDVVRTLLDNGAYVDAQEGKYGTVLQAASREGYDEIVQLLLDKGAARARD